MYYNPNDPVGNDLELAIHGLASQPNHPAPSALRINVDKAAKRICYIFPDADLDDVLMMSDLGELLWRVTVSLNDDPIVTFYMEGWTTGKGGNRTVGRWAETDLTPKELGEQIAYAYSEYLEGI